MESIYKINNLSEIDTPAIAVYPPVIEKNISSALKLGNIGLRNGLRPHVKTFKTLEIAQMMMLQGITKFKCCTISEAEMLGMAGASDVLIAYQPSFVKAKRIAELRQKYPISLFSCLIDNVQTAEMLSQMFSYSPLPVYIDINVGMNRTGLHPEDVQSLISYCLKKSGIKIIGLHGYDGHIHDSEVQIRENQADEIYKMVATVQQGLLKEFGLKLKMVIGGSPTFGLHAQREDIECSPGTFVLWDAGYSGNFPDLPFEVAAVILTRIVSIVDKHKICLDLGHKAVGSENPLPRVLFPDIPDAKVVGHSEEHMVVEVPDSSRYKIDDVWLGIPVHICPTVALHDTLYIIENNTYVRNWKIVARDRKINI